MPCKDHFINFVSPKLVYFSKPLLLTIVISSITFVCWVIGFIFMMATPTISYQTSIGNEDDHARYMGVVHSGGQDICLLAALKLVNGDPGPESHFCWPRDALFDITKKDAWVQESGADNLKWCDGDRAWGKTNCEEKTCVGGMCRRSCVPCDSGKGGKNSDGSVSLFIWYTSSYPAGGSTFGASLGYASYIEIVATLLVITCLLKRGSIKNYRPDFSALAVDMEEMTKDKDKVKEFEKRLERVESNLGIKFDPENPEEENREARKHSLRVTADVQGNTLPGSFGG